LPVAFRGNGAIARLARVPGRLASTARIFYDLPLQNSCSGCSLQSVTCSLLPMKYLHTMVRVADLDASLRFYCDALGLREVQRKVNEKGRFTLVFLAAPGDDEAQVELTYNWDPEDYKIGRAFGHLAYEVENIYTACQRLMDHGVTINRPP